MPKTEMRVHIVDDDEDTRAALALLFGRAGLGFKSFASADELLKYSHPQMRGCLLLDIDMPGMTGMELQSRLLERGIRLPVIFLTGFGDVPSSSRAFRQGALDFLEKPIDNQVLIERVKEAFAHDLKESEKWLRHQSLWEKGSKLSAREREVLRLIVNGQSSKQVGKTLSISHRTVDVYRASIMEKTACKAMTELVAVAQVMGLEDLP